MSLEELIYNRKCVIELTIHIEDTFKLPFGIVNIRIKDTLEHTIENVLLKALNHLKPGCNNINRQHTLLLDK
jgi:hypothetical protein